MRCPTCGHENREGAKFCDECGKRFHSPRLSAASLVEQTITVFTPEPERKIVTTLFSDLTGYTALTERLDPEQVKEITGQVFGGIKAIVAKYEGFIDRLLGDGMLAFFGIPKAHEDDPVRTLQATLEIHEFVKGLSPRYEGRIGVSLSMHSGVNTTKEGERLGARPDLARTYMEVGRCLQEPKSKYRELNGIGAKEYLAKAEKMFREMDLQWDLEQLERVRAGQQV